MQKNIATKRHDLDIPLQNLYIALCFSCFVYPKQKPNKHQSRQSRIETLGVGKHESGL